MENPRNIVLLSIDALRVDHLSCYGYEKNTSPVIDRLAENNVWFKNAYSTSSHTREAVPSMLTGQYPGKFSARGYRLEGPSLASLLQEQSYSTGAFHSNPYASRAYGFDHGFETFDDDLYLGNNRLLALGQRLLDKIRNRHYARAETINDRALAWLDDRTGDDPFFLWAHYMDVHGPYQPPSEFRDTASARSVSDRKAKRLYRRSVDEPESITAEERELQESLYDAEIRYVDEQVGSFLDALEERGLMDDTLVVLTADHGDAFGEAGYYGHPRQLDEALLHVPLIVLGDGVPERTVTSPASTLDIAPTLLGAAGATHDGLPGIPLQDIWTDPESHDERYVFAEATSRDGSERLFRATGLDGHCLMTAEHQSHSVTTEAGQGTDAESVLAEFVRERLEDAQLDRVAADTTENEELEERLRSLGYK